MSVRLEYLLMKPDISELSVEELKRLQEEAEALIASKKSELLEKKINKATDDVLRCFEVVTGAEIQPDEKNNQCSDLFARP